MTETSTYLVTHYVVASRPHAVIYRNRSGGYAFGPLAGIEEAAALYAEMYDPRSTGVCGIGAVWHTRIAPPFRLGHIAQSDRADLDLDPDSEHTPPLIQGGPRLNARHGFVVDIYARDETGADVIGPFPDYVDAAGWWDQQRLWFRPATRAMALPLLAP
jgi:hypothetical protein